MTNHWRRQGQVNFIKDVKAIIIVQKGIILCDVKLLVSALSEEMSKLYQMQNVHIVAQCRLQSCLSVRPQFSEWLCLLNNRNLRRYFIQNHVQMMWENRQNISKTQNPKKRKRKRKNIKKQNKFKKRKKEKQNGKTQK